MSTTMLEAKRQVQWWWPDRPGRRVVDLLLRSPSMSSLQREVDWISANFQDCALAVVRVPTIDRRILESLATAFHDAQACPHICLAIRASALPTWIGSWSSNDRVGLLLDDVDAGTPLSDVAIQTVEALRIAPAFGQDAQNHLRTACILDAILGLARGIGLCTFGSTERSAEADYQFDYVPHPPSKPDS